MKTPLVRSLLTICVLLLPGLAHAEVLHHWTQLIDGTAQSFRAIVSDKQCPAISIDGEAVEMDVRAAPMADFPNLVCEYVSDEPIKSATIRNSPFPLRPPNAQQILVVGDTGCRLKKDAPVQACSNGTAWPYPTIARSMAAKKADIAIHLGDYYYREVPCPNPLICGEAYGDNWQTWKVDFFAPSQVMFSEHPFIFVRGDHENCERGWLGFLRYLAPGPIRTPIMCDNYETPFIVEFEDVQMPVLDSSTRDRDDYTWDRLRAMRSQFLEVLSELDRETLLLTHTPLWGYGSKEKNSKELETLESIQRRAFAHMMPRLISAVVAGDLHFAQIVSTPDNPVQITFGNGGVWLYTTPEGKVEDLPVGEDVTGEIFGYNQFGFGLIDRSGEGLKVIFFDVNGVAVGNCNPPTEADTCELI